MTQYILQAREEQVDALTQGLIERLLHLQKVCWLGALVLVCVYIALYSVGLTRLLSNGAVAMSHSGSEYAPYVVLFVEVVVLFCFGALLFMWWFTGKVGDLYFDADKVAARDAWLSKEGGLHGGSAESYLKAIGMVDVHTKVMGNVVFGSVFLVLVVGLTLSPSWVIAFLMVWAAQLSKWAMSIQNTSLVSGEAAIFRELFSYQRRMGAHWKNADDEDEYDEYDDDKAERGGLDEEVSAQIDALFDDEFERVKTDEEMDAEINAVLSEYKGKKADDNKPAD